MGGLLTPARRDDKFLNKFLNNSVPGEEPWSSLGAEEALQPSPGAADDEQDAWQTPVGHKSALNERSLRLGKANGTRQGQTPSTARLHESLPGCA